MNPSPPIVGGLKGLPWQAMAGSEPSFVKWRQLHWDKFLREGLPSRKLESWHYTDLQKWVAGLSRAAQGEAQGRPLGHLSDQEFHVVFSNGKYLSEQSRLPDGVELHSWADVIRRGGIGSLKVPALLDDFSFGFESLELELGGLAELHQSLFGDGYILRLADGQKLTAPLHILYQWDDQATQSVAAHTNWISLGVGAQADVVEWYRGADNLVSSCWSVVDLGEGAKLELIRAQTHRATAVHLGLVFASLAKGAQFSGVLLDRGGALSRETWAISHYGESASSQLSALQLGEGRSHMDLRTVTQHNQPKGKSVQRSRALLAGPCRTVFNGKIVIAKDAQEVVASQMSQNIVMHDLAEADAKPELEIYADNVKANHGASVGQLNEEELFYLKSRGLPEKEARRLLAEGYAKDIVRDICNETLKRKMESWIQVQVDTLLAEEALS